MVWPRGPSGPPARKTEAVNALFRAAADAQAFCAAHAWRSCVIGGLAVQRWGEPRQTRYVDLTLLAGIGGEEAFIDQILAHFEP